MEVGTTDRRYEWIDEWATIPNTQSGRENGRTHGVAVTRDDRVVVFHQADPAVLIFDQDGELVDSWGSRFGGAHGLTLIEEDTEEYLWLTDQESAEVAKTTLAGDTVLTLAPPDHSAYDGGKYVPTWVAVNEARHGGNGDIWVADGYGESLVHRYDADGAHRGTIDGTDGAGRFECPHAVSVDNRDAEPELYVADRGNERVQVYGPAGQFRRAVESDLTSPCAFDTHDGDLVIPELYGRVTLFDAQDELQTQLGANEEIVEHDEWPNVPDEYRERGAFNSPHDAAFDEDGNIYVVEWIIGGRITKLERL